MTNEALDRDGLLYVVEKQTKALANLARERDEARELLALEREAMHATEAEVERLRGLLAKIETHAREGQEGTSNYALDRLRQIGKVAALGRTT